MTEARSKVISGPGKFELIQSIMEILHPGGSLVQTLFTFQEGKKERYAVITGINGIDKKDRFSLAGDDVRIEGYFLNGVSPYKHHGTPFSGVYNPTIRQGLLQITKNN